MDPTFWIAIATALALAVFVGSRAGGKASKEDVAAWLEQGATVVDVRTPGEFRGGHVKGALNIPVHELDARMSELKQGDKVIVYCRSGARSGRAASLLKAKGYEVLDAGTQAPFPR